MSARRPKPKDVPDVEQAAYDTLQERVVLLTGNAFLFARGDDSLPKKSFEDAVLGRLELDEDLSKHDSTKLLHHARNHEKRHRHEMWEACKEPASQWLQSVEGQTYFETIKSGTAYIDSKLQKPRFPTVNQSLESDWISYELVETAFKDPLLCTTESARSRSSEFFSRLRRATAYAFKFEVWRIARFFSTVPGGIPTVGRLDLKQLEDHQGDIVASYFATQDPKCTALFFDEDPGKPSWFPLPPSKPPRSRSHHGPMQVENAQDELPALSIRSSQQEPGIEDQRQDASVSPLHSPQLSLFEPSPSVRSLYDIQNIYGTSDAHQKAFSDTLHFVTELEEDGEGFEKTKPFFLTLKASLVGLLKEKYPSDRERTRLADTIVDFYRLLEDAYLDVRAQEQDPNFTFPLEKPPFSSVGEAALSLFYAENEADWAEESSPYILSHLPSEGSPSQSPPIVASSSSKSKAGGKKKRKVVGGDGSDEEEMEEASPKLLRSGSDGVGTSQGWEGSGKGKGGKAAKRGSGK